MMTLTPASLSLGRCSCHGWPPVQTWSVSFRKLGMPVISLMAAVFSIITIWQAGQLPGASWAVPSLRHPHGGQTYCFFSCAAVGRASVARVSEPATTNSLRFIWIVLSIALGLIVGAWY